MNGVAGVTDAVAVGVEDAVSAITVAVAGFSVAEGVNANAVAVPASGVKVGDAARSAPVGVKVGEEVNDDETVTVADGGVTGGLVAVGGAGLGVSVLVGVFVGVKVNVGVGDGVRARMVAVAGPGVSVGVKVRVGVRVGVRVKVAVGVKEGVRVEVGVRVGVRVKVGTGVRVGTGVFVGFLVMVGFLVGAARTFPGEMESVSARTGMASRQIKRKQKNKNRGSFVFIFAQIIGSSPKSGITTCKQDTKKPCELSSSQGCNGVAIMEQVKNVPSALGSQDLLDVLPVDLVHRRAESLPVTEFHNHFQHTVLVQVNDVRE